MTVQLVVSASPGERRFARIEDGRVAAIRVARDQGAPYLGAVYLGRVVRLEPGIGGAFVEIGLSKPGFLNLGKRRLGEGDAVAVCVKADPYGEKGARLSLDVPQGLEISEGAKPPLRLLPPADPLIQLQAKGAVDEIVENRPGFAQDPFETSGAAEALEEALSPLVRLPSGGRLLIERTAALWAVDVDTGAQKGPDARFRANQEAAVELARQLRLRNLGGRILVDFAGLPRNRLGKIVSLLKDELARDEMKVHLGGATPLGLVELARERGSACLADLFLGPEAVACAGLRAALSLARANPAARPRLILPMAAIDLLKGAMNPALALAEERLGHVIVLESGDKLEALAQ
ncbi:putative Ribonuclease G and E [Rhodospirillaceae bacterium LM-1]|nr:putative Ribonuclease G and E [Rhodospirillaceae bacterium LM-1]